MNITLNEENFEVAEDTSLSLLLKRLGRDDSRGWAVAVNEKVIPRSDFEETIIKEGDPAITDKITRLCHRGAGIFLARGVILCEGRESAVKHGQREERRQRLRRMPNDASRANTKVTKLRLTSTFLKFEI